MAQIMNIGDYADVQILVAAVSDDTLRTVISRAEAGQFSPRSWHYRLGLRSANESMPPLPIRTFK